MRRVLVAILAAGLMAGAGAWLSAQPTTAITTTLTPTPVTFISTSATSAATITLTPTPGQSVWIQAIDVQNCAGASAVTAAAPTSITTTNLSGGPQGQAGPAWTVGSGVTAGLCQPQPPIVYPDWVKAQSPTLPVTLVLPAFATNQTIRVNVAWRSAP